MGRETAIQLCEQFKGIDAVWAIGRRADRLEELKRSIGVPLRWILRERKGVRCLKTLWMQKSRR